MENLQEGSHLKDRKGYIEIEIVIRKFCGYIHDWNGVLSCPKAWSAIEGVEHEGSSSQS
jgi:hypothetical protein